MITDGERRLRIGVADADPAAVAALTSALAPVVERVEVVDLGTGSELYDDVDLVLVSRSSLAPTPRAPRSIESFGLSEREAHILTLISRGLTNLEIADQTFLSINSVKTYIRTAYKKIGVSTRSQAVLWGVRHGVDQEPDECSHG